jgi:hypothetical protein
MTMSDQDELEAEVDRTKAHYAAHLETCPTCVAAIQARVFMWDYAGCAMLRELREASIQAERRIIARNARAHGDLTHARRIERVIEQVEAERRRTNA